MQPVSNKATVSYDDKSDCDIEMAKPVSDLETTEKTVIESEPTVMCGIEVAKPENGSGDVKVEEGSSETDSPPKKKRKYQKKTPEPAAVVTPGRRSGRAVQKTEVFNVPSPKTKIKVHTPKIVKSDLNEMIASLNETAPDPAESAEALAEKEKEMKIDPDYKDVDPAGDATRTIDPALLLPFRLGWTREISFRQVKSGSSTSDVYYWPPPHADGKTKRRKRRSKLDIERYFDDNPNKFLTKDNFTFAKIMGLNNEDFECVRYAKSMPQYANVVSTSAENKPVRQSLVPSFHSDVRKVEITGDYDDEMPITLQLAMGVTQLRQEHEKRRKKTDRSACRTPPLAEDMPWSYLDDDPLGVYTELGGMSNPATPPPLRAVKVTCHSTVRAVESRVKEIKASLADPYEYAANQAKDDLEQKENMASHDASIKKSEEEDPEEKSEEEDAKKTELALLGDENRTI